VGGTSQPKGPPRDWPSWGAQWVLGEAGFGMRSGQSPPTQPAFPSPQQPQQQQGVRDRGWGIRGGILRQRAAPHRQPAGVSAERHVQGPGRAEDPVSVPSTVGTGTGTSWLRAPLPCPCCWAGAVCIAAGPARECLTHPLAVSRAGGTGFHCSQTGLVSSCCPAARWAQPGHC